MVPFLLQACRNGLFGKRCFSPLPKTGGFAENRHKFWYASYPQTQGALLLRPRKSTKVAGCHSGKITICQKLCFDSLSNRSWGCTRQLKRRSWRICPQPHYLQTVKEKSRYRSSVSTPHLRYGHRLRTPSFVDTPPEHLLRLFLASKVKLYFLRSFLKVLHNQH